MADPIILDRPEWVDTDISALCSVGHLPIVITGALVNVIRQHFLSAELIIDPALKQYIWADSAETTNILIESATKWTGQPTQRFKNRPAIYVKRSQVVPSKLGVGDRYMTGTYPERRPDTNLNYDYAIDTDEQFGLMLNGEHSVFCIGGTPGESESLGSEVFFALLNYIPLIRKELDMYRLIIKGMSGLDKLEESKEHWQVGIGLSWAFKYTWVLRKDEVPLKRIDVGFNVI